MSDVRIDKWLWAVRIYKTRSDAAEACRTNKVTINGSHCKPSREVHEGDVVGVRKVPYMTYTWRVLGLIDKRQGAQNVAAFAESVCMEHCRIRLCWMQDREGNNFPGWQFVQE